ncbi:MAG: TIGR04053 family radical SAM/SPASM domain-containing protein [Acidobacteria bacterium]|jgi:radical SAM protein|nr:TIGR04053 family radical SAM/SPASM domain-containing protein [Acidobacteriota bacterium]
MHNGQLGMHSKYDFSRNPMIVYWEMTNACGLACKHCRAEASPFPHPLELKCRESKQLLRQVAEFGDPLPHVILTGGDPLTRSDIFDLLDYGRNLGIEMSITPSATPTLTEEALVNLKMHGIQSLGLSIDGSCAERHDAIRAVPGCFARTLTAAHQAGQLSLPLQVNTLVAEETADDLPAIYELLTHFPVMRWSLFFLISVGRGKALQEVSPERGEEIMNWVYDLAGKAPFAIKTTEAPSYRRIALKRMLDANVGAEVMKSSSVYRGFQIRDGHGIVFVSNQGEVFPSGFLPVSCGNVRNNSLVQIYRDSPLFRALHAPEKFQGKCGACELRYICGGSRARAFAHTGNPLESDPLCLYQPAAQA